MAYPGPFPLPIKGGGTAQTTSPQFLAYVSAQTTNNVTGDGTFYRILFDNVVSNITSSYNPATGLFTAPVSGNYLITTNVEISNIGAGHVGALLLISTNDPAGNNVFVANCNPFNGVSGNNGTFDLVGTIIIALTVGDTIGVQLQVAGSTKTITLDGETILSNLKTTSFGGYLLK